ncbi:MAG TPA: tripartite tricarboxylate transporter TctB family protein [Stellaceae bacterium]|nr:tripartite tricarboxylate transporter TctB family protein [Stellaceae bacterium]
MALSRRRLLGAPLTDYLPAAGLAAATLAYLALAYGYTTAVRAFPAGVAWVMLVLLALDLASRTETRLGRALMRTLNPAAAAPPAAQSRARQITSVLWVAGFAALMVLVGILGAVPVYVFAATRWHGRRSLGACVAVAAGATFFVWLLFSVVLRLALYPGLVFGGAA